MDDKLCYIVGAGEFSGGFIPEKDDFVIAADGGYEHLKNAGIRADIIIGDFDSLSERPSHQTIIELSKEKDDTDMMAALREGLARGYKSFMLYGGMGGRLDHTLANIQLLAYISQNGSRGYLIGSDMTITAITDGAIELPARQSGYISAFSHSDTSTGVYEKGLKYRLDDAVLHSSYPLGVSNEFIGKPAVISVKKGTLVITIQK